MKAEFIATLTSIWLGSIAIASAISFAIGCDYGAEPCDVVTKAFAQMNTEGKQK